MTIVTYPHGDTASRGTVVALGAAGGRTAVMLDVTAFHPVDTAWPDQPADRGALVLADGARVPIVDAVVAASPHDGDATFFGRDVPVRTGTEGWSFGVGHLVEGEPVAVGDTVEVEVDAAYRAALSAGHTACHLASLALDAALAGAWRKDVPLDVLGAPAFDALAIEESRIVPDGARDVYRIGKSLRRKGFDPAALDDLGPVAAHANALLEEWIRAGGEVRIETAGDTLADRRMWVCTLPGGEARIPCGGTHVTSLAALSSVTIALEAHSVEGAIELVMQTSTVRA